MSNQDREPTERTGEPLAASAEEVPAAAETEKPVAEANGGSGKNGNGGGDQGKPKDPAEKSLFQQTFGPALKLAGRTALIGALLLFFGFLSQSALFRFAGLPLLSADPTAWVEAGAMALVDSFGQALSGFFRPFLVVVLLGGGLLLWLFRERPKLRRLASAPLLCLVTEVVFLVLAVTLVVGLIGLAQRADPARWEGRVEMAREVRDEALTEGRWSPTDLHEAVWRTTYEITSPPWTLLNSLARFNAKNGAASSLVGSRHSLHTPRPYGEPLRLSPAAGEAARELYGWVFLTGFLLAGLVLAVRLWSRWLAEDVPESSDVPRGVDHDLLGRLRIEPTHVSAATRRFVEPLLTLAAVLVIALLPVAHGVLAQPGIGHEEVIVRLKDQESCAPDGEGDPPATEHSSEGEGRNGPDDTRNAEQVSARVIHERCSRGKLDALASVGFDYASSLLLVLSTRPGPAREQVMGDYRDATDKLMDSALEQACVGAFQQVWQLRPHPAVYARDPVAAQYFWDRWQEVQARASNLRFGKILHYPRGAQLEKLPLFETVTNQTPLHRGRWALRELRRECVEETIVVPDLVHAHLDSVIRTLTANPDSPAFRELNLYVHPATLQAAIDLLERRIMSSDAQGVLITLTGTLAGVFKDYEPDLVDRAEKDLQAILLDADASLFHRRSAATALHLVGGAHGARALAEALDAIGEPEAANRLGPIITSAGYLAQDVWSTLEELGGTDLDRLPPGACAAELPGPDGYRDLRQVGTRLNCFLRHVATDPVITADSSNRASACTALELARRGGAGRDILRTAEMALEGRDPVTLGTCVSALGSARVREGRELLRTVSRQADPWVPTDVRQVALSALYSLGLDEEVEVILALYLGDENEFVAQAAAYLGVDIPLPPGTAERRWNAYMSELVTVLKAEAANLGQANLTEEIAELEQALKSGE